MSFSRDNGQMKYKFTDQTFHTGIYSPQWWEKHETCATRRWRRDTSATNPDRKGYRLRDRAKETCPWPGCTNAHGDSWK
jgi:hypothetical protein